MKYAEEGYEIQVGDYIENRLFNLSVSRWRVHRVTPKFAYVRYNEHCEERCPRVYRGIGFRLGPYQRDQHIFSVIKRADFLSAKNDAQNETAGEKS